MRIVMGIDGNKHPHALTLAKELHAGAIVVGLHARYEVDAVVDRESLQRPYVDKRATRRVCATGMFACFMKAICAGATAIMSYSSSPPSRASSLCT